MFLLFPKKIRITTSLTAKQCREKMTRDMVEYTRRPSIVAASSFIKAHRLENCYYGSCVKKDGVINSEIFYHRAKKHDGSSAGFFGTVTKTEDGKVLLAPAIPDVIGKIDLEAGTMEITPLDGLFDI